MALTPKEPNPADTKHTVTLDRRGVLAQGAALTASAVVASVVTAPRAAAATDRYVRGMAALQNISGDGGSKVIASLADIAPDLGRFIVEFTYGDIYPRPGLDAPQRQLVTIGALAAQGDTKPQLNFHTAAALQVGVSPVEILESIIHLIPFTGFPRVLNSITVVREVFAARGIALEPPVLADARNRYDRGAEKLAEVDGQHGLDVIDSLNDIAPDLGRYIVEFAFGDVYYRPWLDLRKRQLVTIGALTALGDTAPQLKVHLGAALNVGLSRAQVLEVLIHLVSYTGFPRVLNALTVARDVFAQHR